MKSRSKKSDGMMKKLSNRKTQSRKATVANEIAPSRKASGIARQDGASLSFMKIPEGRTPDDNPRKNSASSRVAPVGLPPADRPTRGNIAAGFQRAGRPTYLEPIDRIRIP